MLFPVSLALRVACSDNTSAAEGAFVEGTLAAADGTTGVVLAAISISTRLVTGLVIQLVLNAKTEVQLVRFRTFKLVWYACTKLVSNLSKISLLVTVLALTLVA